MPCPVSEAVEQYNQFTQFITYCECVVVAASVFASYLHFEESGKKVTTATLFHLMHLLFCAIYSIAHVLEHFAFRFCLCGWVQLYNPIYNACFLATCAIFIRYWKKAVSIKDEKWQIRVIVYFGLWLFVLIEFCIAITKKPCNKHNFDNAVDVFPRLLIIAIFVDSSFLASLCLRRLEEMQAETDSTSRLPMFLQPQALPFILLPCSFGCGFILVISTDIEGTYVWQLFCYLFPSITMLGVMWRRRYLDLDKDDESDDVTWSSNPGVELEWIQSLHGDSSKHSVSQAHTTETVKSLQSNLKEFTPLFARHEIKDPYHQLGGSQSSSHLTGIAQDQANSNDLVNTNIDTRSKSGSAEDALLRFMKAESIKLQKETLWLVVEEELKPPEDALAIVQSYAANCVLPALEESYRMHEMKVTAILRAAAPNKPSRSRGSSALEGEVVSSTHFYPASISKAIGSSTNLESGNTTRTKSHSSGKAVNHDVFGGLERQRLFDDLKSKLEILSRKYAEWLNIVKVQTLNLPEPLKVPARTSLRFSSRASSLTPRFLSSRTGSGHHHASSGTSINSLSSVTSNGSRRFSKRPSITVAGGAMGGSLANVSESTPSSKEHGGESNVLANSFNQGSSTHGGGARTVAREWNGQELRGSSVHHRFLSATGFLFNQKENRFKPSVAKKADAVSLIPINCMVHTTLLRKMNGSDLEVEHQACSEGEEILLKPDDSFVISSITFGAPAAHALGFKNGGLNDVINKLNKMSGSRGRDSQMPSEQPYDSSGSGIGVGSLASLNSSSISSSTTNSYMSDAATPPRMSSTLYNKFKRSSAEEMYSMRTAKKVARNPESAIKQLTFEFEAVAREGVVVSQALTAIVSAAVDLLRRLIGDGLKEEEAKFNAESMQAPDELEETSLHGINCYEKLSQWSGGAAACARQLSNFGMVIHSACLLSTAGHEDGMIDDFAAAYDRLDVNLRLHECTNHNHNPNLDNPNEISVRVLSVTKGDKDHLGSVQVEISVSPKSAYEWLSDLLVAGKADIESAEERFSVSTPVPCIRLIPILFNIGVNEMQSVANATFSQAIKKQSDINEKGLVKLKSYYTNVKAVLGTSLHWSSLTHDLVQQINQLVEADAASHGKIVDLLSVSAALSRLLNGARTTSCKSAKDRTSVFHSLEVAKASLARGLIDSSKEQELLDLLRGSNGVRLRNCEANTGKAKYAFNKLQMQALPVELRPPAYTASSGKS